MESNSKNTFQKTNTIVDNSQTKANRMLEAALQHMDGIVAGILTVIHVHIFFCMFLTSSI